MMEIWKYVHISMGWREEDMRPMGDEEAKLFHRYICEGLGDPKRLRILYLLAEEPRNVSQLTDALGVSQPTVSHHLRILRERGLVRTERQGQCVCYSIGDMRLMEALEVLRALVADMLDHSAEILNP